MKRRELTMRQGREERNNGKKIKLFIMTIIIIPRKNLRHKIKQSERKRKVIKNISQMLQHNIIKYKAASAKKIYARIMNGRSRRKEQKDT